VLRFLLPWIWDHQHKGETGPRAEEKHAWAHRMELRQDTLQVRHNRAVRTLAVHMEARQSLVARCNFAGCNLVALVAASAPRTADSPPAR
jgi:hypothetical protein